MQEIQQYTTLCMIKCVFDPLVSIKENLLYILIQVATGRKPPQYHPMVASRPRRLKKVENIKQQYSPCCHFIGNF